MCRSGQWALIGTRIPKRSVGFCWVRKVYRCLPKQMCESGGPAERKARTRGGDVGVDVGDNMLLQKVLKIFAKLCRANKTGLESCVSMNELTRVGSSTSSASQLAMSKVRSGRQPFRSKAPSPFTTSTIAAVPDMGSPAPRTQASRWQPSNTTSCFTWPGMTAMVFQIGNTFVST